jgi:hypothetical protein
LRSLSAFGQLAELALRYLDRSVDTIEFAKDGRRINTTDALSR